MLVAREYARAAAAPTVIATRWKRLLPRAGWPASSAHTPFLQSNNINTIVAPGKNKMLVSTLYRKLPSSSLRLHAIDSRIASKVRVVSCNYGEGEQLKKCELHIVEAVHDQSDH